MQTLRDETEQMTITVPKQLATSIREAVSSNGFADESEFLVASAHFYLSDEWQDPSVTDEVLRREVLPVLLEMKANPSRGIPIEEARARFEDRAREPLLRSGADVQG
jgi:antitoxin ParD1/3/4